MWITTRSQKITDCIRDAEKAKFMNSISGAPKHLV